MPAPTAIRRVVLGSRATREEGNLSTPRPPAARTGASPRSEGHRPPAS
jgi:hypothetical protein